MTRISHTLLLLAACALAAPLQAQRPALSLLRYQNNTATGMGGDAARTGNEVRLDVELGPLAPWAGVAFTTVLDRICDSAPCDSETPGRTLSLGLDYRFRRGGPLVAYVGASGGEMTWRDGGRARIWEVHAGADLALLRGVALRLEAQPVTSTHASIAMGLRISPF